MSPWNSDTSMPGIVVGPGQKTTASLASPMRSPARGGAQAPSKSDKVRREKRVARMGGRTSARNGPHPSGQETTGFLAPRAVTKGKVDPPCITVADPCNGASDRRAVFQGLGGGLGAGAGEGAGTG